MSAVAAGVDDALGDALVVEVLGLFDEEEVFDQDRAAGIGLEGVLIVGDDGAALVGHLRMGAAGNLVDLTAGWGLLPGGSDGDGSSGNHFLCF